MKYRNTHRKPLLIGDALVEPGGSFSDAEAFAAGVNVAALIRARVVTPVKTRRTTKARVKAAD